MRAVGLVVLQICLLALLVVCTAGLHEMAYVLESLQQDRTVLPIWAGAVVSLGRQAGGFFVGVVIVFHMVPLMAANSYVRRVLRLECTGLFVRGLWVVGLVELAVLAVVGLGTVFTVLISMHGVAAYGR